MGRRRDERAPEPGAPEPGAPEPWSRRRALVVALAVLSAGVVVVLLWSQLPAVTIAIVVDALAGSAAQARVLAFCLGAWSALGGIVLVWLPARRDDPSAVRRVVGRLALLVMLVGGLVALSLLEGRSASDVPGLGAARFRGREALLAQHVDQAWVPSVHDGLIAAGIAVLVVNVVSIVALVRAHRDEHGVRRVALGWRLAPTLLLVGFLLLELARAA